MDPGERVESVEVMPLAWVLLGLGLGIGTVPPAGGGPVSSSSSAAGPGISREGFIGRTAPDFELASVNGMPLRLSSLRGRAVLLNFWATWCAACRVETPWLVDLQERLRGKLQVVGISMDEPGARGVAEFARANRMTYPILLGGKSIAADYGGVRFLPQTFLIDRWGRVVESVTGIESRKSLQERIRRILETGSRLP